MPLRRLSLRRLALRRLAPRGRELVCRDAVELVTDYLEEALSRSDRRRFEFHLRNCEHCTEYLAQMRATIRATGRVEVASLDPRALDDLVGLYQSWLAG